LNELIRQFLDMSLPALFRRPLDQGGGLGEVTPLNSGRQFKPFVYLNRPGGCGTQRKSPAFRRGFPCFRSAKSLAAAGSLLAGVLTLTVWVLLLLTGLVAPALLLTGLLSGILVLLARLSATRVYQQLPNIEKDRINLAQAKPLSESYAGFTTGNPKGVIEAFNKQYESMMQAIGSPLMQAALPVMKSVTEMFSQLGAFANTNPDAIRAIGYGLAGLAGGLLALGGVALASLAAVPLAISAIVGAVAAFAYIEWDTIKNIAAGLRDVASAIGVLAAQRWEIIRSNVDSVISAISKLVDYLGGIAGKISGFFSGVFGGAAPNQPKVNPDGTDPNYQNYLPMWFDPGNKGTLKAQPITLSLNVDGRTLAQTLSDQLEYLYEHPTGAPSYDGMRRHIPGDGGMVGT
jgi:hypothetical protein